MLTQTPVLPVVFCASHVQDHHLETAMLPEPGWAPPTEPRHSKCRALPGTLHSFAQVSRDEWLLTHNPANGKSHGQCWLLLRATGANQLPFPGLPSPLWEAPKVPGGRTPCIIFFETLVFQKFIETWQVLLSRLPWLPTPVVSPPDAMTRSQSWF